MAAAHTAPPLIKLHLQPIGDVNVRGNESELDAWIAAQREENCPIESGETFVLGGCEYGIMKASPSGGIIASNTSIEKTLEVAPHVSKVQLVYLEPPQDGASEDDIDGELYSQFVRPWLQRRRLSRKMASSHEAARFLAVVSKNEVIDILGERFGVMALDPDVRRGALDVETLIFVKREMTPLFDKIHILPYGDTLPGAYNYDLFTDYLRPFLQQHPFSRFSTNDHFTYQSVRFRVVGTQPENIVGRLGPQTVVYYEGGPLMPSVMDMLPEEVQQELAWLPPGLQMLLLNTMANESAVMQQLTSVREVLRRGQGLSSSAINSCETIRWSKELPECQNNVSTQCMVCLCEFEAGEELRRLACRHLFHKDCIDEWLVRSNVCPVCKQPAVVPAQPSGFVVPRGTSVIIQGLASAEGARHNGHRGIIVGPDASTGRYHISLEEGTQTTMSVLPKNFVQCVSGVRLHGLKRAEFNGHTGQIISFDEAALRYELRLHGSTQQVLKVQLANCVFPASTVVRVCGLQNASASQWNGQYGKVVSFDDSTQRHIVQMNSQHQLSVKGDNLRV
eukprot:gnl/MRDRNA2_/MRDRNA2_131214_c0_seq1.p1 gnl/MRDRNA2_/MRDRNA2_131214_c0~~gnl/MRDRNA2_/MRDRNA2_131214_c0_seq1.p1  ORF type:complete len:563 (+),score=93.04 gnl/MRDRNA2_/MRDRNA2_131214_c0_seq1:63-1751(+)